MFDSSWLDIGLRIGGQEKTRLGLGIARPWLQYGNAGEAWETSMVTEGPIVWLHDARIREMKWCVGPQSIHR